MHLSYSIRGGLKRSFRRFALHPWFYLALTFVMVILNLTGRDKNAHYSVSAIALYVVVIIAALIWTYVWLSAILAGVDEREDMLTFKSLHFHLPNFRQFFTLIGLAIITAVIVVGGFIVLIIPGIYFMTRLAFGNFAFVDRQGGAIAALRRSWAITKGNVFWTAILVILIAGALIVLGAIALGIGLLFTYPIAMLLLADLYRALSTYADQKVLADLPAQTGVPENVSPIIPEVIPAEESEAESEPVITEATFDDGAPLPEPEGDLISPDQQELFPAEDK